MMRLLDLYNPETDEMENPGKATARKVAATLQTPGMTQLRLAALLGVHPVAVSRWANGHRQPSEAVLMWLEVIGTVTPGRWPKVLRERWVLDMDNATTTIKLTRCQWTALWDCITRGGDLRHDETPTPRPVRLRLADCAGTIDLTDGPLVTEALDWLGEVVDRTESYPSPTRAAACRAIDAIRAADKVTT